jgi:hypothetical protein
MVIPDGLPPNQVGEITLTSRLSEAFEAKLTRSDWRFFHTMQQRSPVPGSRRDDTQTDKTGAGHESQNRPQLS